MEDSTSTQQILLQVLERATSQNPEILKVAEANLKEWEVQPGFYYALLEILLNQSLNVTVRWMAVLYIKNAVEKSWRRTQNSTLSEEEKQKIRMGLVSNFLEPIQQISVQKAILISKIARIDVPKEWPDIFPIIINAVEDSNSLIQYNALLTLHHVIKAISSKRLMGDRKFFHDFTMKVYSYILNIWYSFSDEFLNCMSSNKSVEEASVTLTKALLALRILRKLSAFGFYKPQEHKICMEFMHSIFERIKIFLQVRMQLKTLPNHNLGDLCDKTIIHLSKVLITILVNHPFAYVNFIRPSLELTVYYLFNDEGNQYLFERFTIQCLNLLRNILICIEYKPPKVIENCKYPETVEAHSIKTVFFTSSILHDICKKIVLKYFPLSRQELEVWNNDGEAFAADDFGDSWKYSLRPSIENLYIAIFHEFRDTLTGVVMSMIHEINNLPINVENTEWILRKDAVYNAVSLSAFDLYDEVDFDKWLTTHLVKELEVQHSNYKIIKRRVCILMGKWVGIKMSTELRPFLYEEIIKLLRPEEDIAVRITASTALRSAIDDFEFNCENFCPYLDSAFNGLFVLLKEINDSDPKMNVLTAITLMVERVGNHIAPYKDQLIQYLSFLWNDSESQHMLRSRIVSILVQLVKAIGTISSDFKTFLYPIIHLGIDVSQQSSIYLLEDCLELWLVVLENSTTMCDDLLQLFNHMPVLLDYSSENLRICLYIVLVHTLLSPEVVLRVHGIQIVSVCNNLISDMKNEGVAMLLRTLEVFIKSVSPLGTETVFPILPRLFQRIYENDQYPLIMSMHLAILSRVLLSSHEVFIKTISDLAEYHQENVDTMLSKILDVWLINMPAVTQLEQRKLLALALCNLLTTQSIPVLERFPKVIQNILESLNDIYKFHDNGEIEDSLLLTDERTPSYYHEESDGYYETNHDQRHKQLILCDPVYTIVLREYFQSQLYSLQNQIGTESYKTLLEKIETANVAQLKTFVQL